MKHHAKEDGRASDLFELLFDSNVKGVCVCVYLWFGSWGPASH